MAVMEWEVLDTAGGVWEVIDGYGSTFTVLQGPVEITGGGGLSAEEVRDLVAAFVAGGSNVTVTHDDEANTLTIAVSSAPPSGGAGGALSGSYPNPGLNEESVQDLVAGFIEAGSGVTVTYDDSAGTLTISAAGGGGAAGELRVLDVVADGTTTTTVTATGGVLDYDVLDVATSDPAGERARIILPHPSEWPNQILWLVGDDMGASVGYPVDTPAVLGDFATWAPGALDFSVNPVTVEFDLNGSPLFVTVDADYTSNPAALAGAIIGQLAAEGVELVVGGYLNTVTGETLGTALITPTVGDAATLSVVDPGTGGPGNVADPLNFGDLTSTPGKTGWYAGWDNGVRGVGELNAPDATGFTHSWFDGSTYTAKSLGLFSDGTILHALRIPLRWEEVYGVTEQIDGPLDSATNVGQAIDAANQALKDLAGGVLPTVTVSGGTLTATEPGLFMLDGANFALPPAADHVGRLLAVQTNGADSTLTPAAGEFVQNAYDGSTTGAWTWPAGVYALWRAVSAAELGGPAAGWVALAISAEQTGGSGTATDTSYDNDTSGLAAANVQDAIDETVALVESVGNSRLPTVPAPSTDGGILVFSDGGGAAVEDSGVTIAELQPASDTLDLLTTLETTPFGRSLLEQSNAPAARATLGVGRVVGGQDGGTRVENTTTETRILDGTITLPALAAGELFMFRGAFLWLNNSGATRTLTLRVKVGATTLLTAVSGTLGSNATARNGRIEGYIRANGNNDADGEMNVVVTNASDPTNSLGTEITVNGTMTEAVQTAGLAFDLTAQMPTNNATQWVELQSFAIWRVST